MREPKGERSEPGRTLDVACRYYRVWTSFEVPCEERNFGFVERRLPVPVGQAALVLVDV